MSFSYLFQLVYMLPQEYSFVYRYVYEKRNIHTQCTRTVVERAAERRLVEYN